MNELHLNDYIVILKKRKNIFFTFFFVVVFIVTIGSFLIEPVYRATVTLLIDIESPNVLTTSGSVELGGTNYYAYKEYFYSQKEIIKSRSIIEKVFREFNLIKDEDYKNEKDPIESFSDTINVEPVRDTRLLLLHVDNKDPKKAAFIANRIAKVYVKRNLEYISKSEYLNLLKNEYLKLQSKLSEYAKIYKHKHPKMVRLRREVNDMAIRIREEKLGKRTSNQGYTNVLLAGLKANNISIQDEAKEPIVPFYPKKRLNIIIAIFIGLLGGVIFSFFFEYLDDSINSVEDINRLAKWPFLGSVPIFNRKICSKKECDKFVHVNPKDSVSESYRNIRTSLYFSFTKENAIKNIAVTSSGPEEGKSTTVCNLGIALSHNDKKVLLVDGDMRRARLHKVFDIDLDKGLSSFLSDQAGVKEIIQKTDIKNLYVVSSGPHPPNPSELLTSSKLKEFIDFSKTHFDFVLFDTPPLAIVTDALIISHVTDGVIVVVESAKTHKKALERVIQLLKDSDTKVIGTIMNKLAKESTGYNYYASYYGKK